MSAYLEAYLDIETTGLSFHSCQITVVGVHLCRGNNGRFVQLVGDEISAESLLEILQGVEVLYTYNGSRFDLRGGFKAVERQLGIPRRLMGMNGHEAVRLWWRYANDYDRRALAVLLEYNREDVLNLKALREKLETCR